MGRGRDITKYYQVSNPERYILYRRQMNPRVLRVTRPLSLGTPTGDPNIQAPFVFFKIQWLVPPKYIVALLMFAVLTSFFVNRILRFHSFTRASHSS
jgi:hypothetical protein